MMKKKFTTLAIVSVLATIPQVFAGDEEYVEVTAPNECCQTPMPGTLGLLMGMVGAPTGTGSGSVRDVALKAAMNKALKEKNKKQKKEEEKNDYDKATDGKSDTSTLYQEIGSSWRDLMSTGSKERLKYSKTNPDGSSETVEYENCVPSGPLNPKVLNCTEQKFELFTDPTDGAERWAFTLSVIEAAYNPKHYYANKNGWYPKVVDDQIFTIVFETEADLLWQLNRIAGR